MTQRVKVWWKTARRWNEHFNTQHDHSRDLGGRPDQNEASKDPEILCQIENTAPGNAASGEKYKRPNVAANPEFCIPTSSARVRQTDSSKPNSRPPQ